MKIKLEVYVNDEYFDDTPDLAYVEIDKAFIERIFFLQKKLEEIKVDKMSTYEGDVTFMQETNEGEEEHEDFRYECLMLNVYKGEIDWSFLIKHTNISCNLQSLYVEELKRMYEAMTCPIEDLPTMVNEENKNIQAIVKERLSESTCS